MKNPKKILIVEDEFIIASSIKAILEMDKNTPFVCRTVASGQEAIDACGALEPDLILMDVGLPGGLDGIEAAHRIRLNSKVPIVFMSGYSDPETVEKTRVLAPSSFLTKPTSDEKIKNQIVATLANATTD